MNFNTKLIMLVIMLGFVFSSQTQVLAYEEDIWEVNFLAFDDQGESYWVVEKINFEFDMSKEEKAGRIFEVLFHGKSEPNFYNLPIGTKVHSTKFEDDLLIINVSGDILLYNYGSYYEVLIKDKIVKNALNISGVNRVTLLIDGEVAYLKKGLTIYEVSNSSKD